MTIWAAAPQLRSNRVNANKDTAVGAVWDSIVGKTSKSKSRLLRPAQVQANAMRHDSIFIIQNSAMYLERVCLTMRSV